MNRRSVVEIVLGQCGSPNPGTINFVASASTVRREVNPQSFSFRGYIGTIAGVLATR